MKQTSTNSSITFKKYLAITLTFLSLAFGQFVYAHSVDSYSGTCASGPQYKVTAVVSNVNNTSNYRWQWKNASNAWVCFVNGNNTINGNTYNVSGAIYNLTTTPGPIVFTNPNSGLQGLQIRMVISDGNGVNPCNLPANNTWTSTNPFVINVNSTPCGANGSIGDRVWLDANVNGLQDATETGGISGVTVQLRNSANTVIATQTTNSTGNYLFTGLAAGTYTVVFPVSVSVGVLTTANVGSNDNIDSDPSATTGITANIVLTTNQSNLTVDAGYRPTNLQLGNRVWYDTDNDGINDASEAGIKNITVKLYKDDNNDNVADGAAIATQITDINGNYTFTNLVPGNYIVGATIPAGYMSSAVNGGDPDNNTDLDDNGQVVAGTEIRGLAITLTSGGEPTSGSINNTYDFGMLPDCTCTNSTANLLVNESFENGTTGWSWSSANGSLTTGTGYVACGTKNGFNNQSSGTSKVWQDVTMSAGQIVTFSAFAGTHTPGISCSPKLSLLFLNASNTVLGQTDVTVTRDVDVNNSQLEQYTITATAPAGTTKARVQSSITCNTMKLDAFCLTATPGPGSIGDRVWYDTDRDGIQDASENGISGVTVKLRNASNAVIATTTTNSSGNYLFSNLTAGTYSVEFPVTVYGYVLSPAYVGTNRDIDSDPSTTTGVTPSITLSAGQNIVNIDAGFAPDCACVNSTGNLLVNGSFENGTTGWSWSTANGSLTTGTGYVACGAANGFNNQSSGTSKVWQDVSMSAGATVTFKGYAGTHTPGIACSPTLSLIFLNAANTVLGQSNVTVTRDVDINNSQLELYSITAVAPTGTTKVRVQSAINCNTMKIDAFCLTAVIPANLNVGNFVWYDANNDGVQDATEPGISGATVKLYADANGDNVPDGAAIATTSTNAGGAYNFGSLAAGNYIVGVTIPAGYAGATTTATSASPNNDNNTDNNGVTIVSGELRSNFITLSAGAEPTTDGDGNNGNLTLDFGLKGTGSIGDYVWEDLNRDGLQDASEPPIAGVVVTLTTPLGTLTDTTDANGNYNFTNLAPGTYSVAFETPATYLTTQAKAGSNDAIDSDPVGGVVSNIVLAAGEVKNTVDAGFYRLINISGHVWNDANGLTDLQINKTGLQAIPNSLSVYLVDVATNLVVQREFILTDGSYSFLDVDVNHSYKIVLSTTSTFPGQAAPSATLPSGWSRVGENLGAGPLSGSDGVPNGLLFIDTETNDVFEANFGIRVSSGEVIVG